MLKSCIIIAFRNLVKNKFSSILNFAGLSLGLVCFIIIGLYVMYEFDYDNYHHNASHIYRIEKRVDPGDGIIKNIGCIPAPLAFTLKSEYPDIVKEVVRFYNYWGLGFNVQYKRNIFHVSDFAFCDSTIFKIFDLKLITGNPSTALDNPYTVVLTESTAKKYFGTEDPIGKSIKVDDSYDLQVTGIINDIPAQSHFHFGFLASFSTLKTLPWRGAMNDWWEEFCYTYILLDDNFTKDFFEGRLSDFTEKYLPPERNKTDSYYLQPVVNIHLYADIDDELEPQSNILYSKILLSIAIFIILMAILNYINLSTAYSKVRAKEIGIRKVYGSQRARIILQFIGESVIFTLIALVVSLFVVELILPWFSNNFGKDISFGVIEISRMILLVVLIGIIVSLLSGAYPAFYISSFKPIEILSSISKENIRNRFGRRILVIIQLTISTALIIGTMMISKQLRYIESYDLNYDKNNIIILSVNSTPIAHDHYDAFLNDITQDPGVLNASGMRMIAGYDHIKEGFAIEGYSSEQERLLIPFLLVRHNFIQTFDIEIIAGRNFSEEFPTDEAEAVLINETLAKQIGPNNEEIIGKIMNHDGWGKLKIIGIIRDINFESLHTSVKPLIIKLIWSSRHGALTDYIAVRLTSQNINQSIKFIEDTWNKYAPNSAFDYEFLDHRLDQFYKSERTLGYLSPIFTIIAIIISCLGLLGFIAFIAERRTKEIAIRKVFGATINIIVRFISMEFILLILIANFIAWIAIYFAVAKWLQNFAFQTKIPLMVFVIATLITFVTSFLAIIFHTLKASHTNPVDHLRYE